MTSNLQNFSDTARNPSLINLTKNGLVDSYEAVQDNAVKRLLPRQQLGDMGRKINGILYIDRKMMKWNDIFCTLFSLKAP